MLRFSRKFSRFFIFNDFSYLIKKLFYRIISALVKGMATQNTLCRHKPALYRPVFFYGLKRIGRAGGVVSAVCANVRRNKPLIALYQQHHY